MEKKGNVNECRFSNSSGRNSSGRSSRSSTSSSSKTNNEKEVTIVVCSRLTYRKGIHLLAKLIPLTLKENKNVRFIIAGSGPMEPHLREVCEKTHKKGVQRKNRIFRRLKTRGRAEHFASRGYFLELFVDGGVLYGYR